MRSRIYCNYTTSIKRRNVMYYANDIVTKQSVVYSNLGNLERDVVGDSLVTRL
jgi:hypothetical protein